MKERSRHPASSRLPSAGLAAAAVLADSVTMRARATVLRSDEAAVGVFGAISSGAEGEYVTVKGKECGIPGAFFRAPRRRDDPAGGAYEASVFVRTKTTLRAEWNGPRARPSSSLHARISRS